MSMERRKFITSITGAAIGAPLIGKSRISPNVPPPPKVTLGNTGITTTRMAQGTGMSGTKMQSNQTRQGFDSFVGLLRHGYDRGIRFYDLADQYGSHLYMREALRYLPRQELTLLSKFQYRFDGPEPDTLDWKQQKHSARKAIDRYRLELNTDYLDIVLMHNMVTPLWDKDCTGYIEALFEAKEKGIIKAIGMSCHTLVALERAAELDWVKVAFTRINAHQIAMDGPVDQVIPVQKRFKARGASVVGMKIFGAGKLVDQRDACMQFAQNLGYLDAMTLGAEKPEHIDENLRLMAKYPATS